MMKKEKSHEALREILSAYITEKTNPEDIQWIEEQEVINWLRVSRSTMYRLRKNRLILHCKMGGRCLYPKELIQKFFFYIASKSC